MLVFSHVTDPRASLPSNKFLPSALFRLSNVSEALEKMGIDYDLSLRQLY